MIQTMVALLMMVAALTSCTKEVSDVGTQKNPIKLFFVPSVNTEVIQKNSKIIEKILEQRTSYKFDISISKSFIDTVEAFGAQKADVAAINTFGYLLAYEKYGAEAGLTAIRHGASTYQAQFIAKKDSAIHTLKDLQDKKIAFVDVASFSGYLLPFKILRRENVEPSEEVFSRTHDNVVTKVYNGEVDAGATFYSPPYQGKMQDARHLILDRHPDVEDKIKIVSVTESFPNEPIVFRKGLPPEVRAKLIDAFIALMKTPEGRSAFDEISDVTDFKKASDLDYEGIRDMLATVGKTAQELIK